MYARLLRASSTASACTYRAVAADTGAIGGDRVARVPGHRRHRRGRDRLLPGLATTRPTSSWPRRCRAGRAARAPAAAAEEDADAGQEHLRGRRRSCSACRWRTTVKSLVLATDELRRRRRPVRDHGLAAAGARRPLAQRGQGRQGRRAEGRLPLRHRGRDRGPLRLQARLPRARSARRKPVKVVADRTVARDERLRLRRQRGGLPLHRRQLGPRPARARPRRRHPQRRRRRSSPDGKGVLAIQRGIEVGHVF